MSETPQNGNAEWTGYPTWDQASTAARAHAVRVAILERARAHMAQSGLPHADLDARLQEAYARHLDLMAEARRRRPRARPAAEL